MFTSAIQCLLLHSSLKLLTAWWLVSQGLLDKPQALFALVLSPTRELAIQIAEQFEALGSDIGVRCAVLVGGIDMMAQAIALGKRPHIIVGTPGRVVDHLSNTKVSLQWRTVDPVYSQRILALIHTVCMATWIAAAGQ